ncbi:hypothetical protein OSTOST_25203, partial [Ostertagia ostertagi]
MEQAGHGPYELIMTGALRTIGGVRMERIVNGGILNLIPERLEGSHDSAATQELDKKGPVAGDLSGFIRRVAKGPCIKAGIKRWAICQSYLIREALERGIRYLDLRVAYPPPKMRAHDKVRSFKFITCISGRTSERLNTMHGP